VLLEIHGLYPHVGVVRGDRPPALTILVFERRVWILSDSCECYGEPECLDARRRLPRHSVAVGDEARPSDGRACDVDESCKEMLSGFAQFRRGPRPVVRVEGTDPPTVKLKRCMQLEIGTEHQNRMPVDARVRSGRFAERHTAPSAFKAAVFGSP
jgi:hypothetical protein